jgi:nucleoside-diphosphate-sugar epimerase
MAAAMQATNRLRRETVAPLVRAGAEAGARRAVVQSISFVTKPDGRPVHDEDAPLLDDPMSLPAIDAVRSLEAATTQTEGIEGIALRYGFYYGPGTWYDRDGAIATMVRKRRYPLIGGGDGRSSFVHVDDAVEATIRAFDRGAPGVYNITSDEAPQQKAWLPEVARLLGAKKPLRIPAWVGRRLAGPVAVHYATTLPGNANDRARAAFDWSPRPWREGFAEVFA